MRTTGLGLSAFLAAAGAILAWAVSYEIDGIDVQMVGLILFIVGIVLGAVTLVIAMNPRRANARRDQMRGPALAPPVQHRQGPDQPPRGPG